MKIKAAWIWVVGIVTAALAAVMTWIHRKDALEAQESHRKAEALKQKIAEVKAEQEARKVETDAAVAKVDEAAKVDMARDPVELANAVIHDGRGSSDPITKG